MSLAALGGKVPVHILVNSLSAISDLILKICNSERMYNVSAKATQTIRQLHVWKDMEIMSKVIAEFECDDCPESVRACISNLKESLHDVVTLLDELSRPSTSWFFGWRRKDESEALRELELAKNHLDHHFNRFVQVRDLFRDVASPVAVDPLL
jgi:hypothetical protein